MQVLFTRLFLKDIQKITDEVLKREVNKAIEDFENTVVISELKNIKKLKGHKTAYRLRIGKYRLGFHYDDGVIKLTRFVKRESIYKLFP